MTSVDVVVVSQHFEGSIIEEDIDLTRFVSAYEELNKVVGLLGPIFYFVQEDITSKTNLLNKLMVSETYITVRGMLLHESGRSSKPGAMALLSLHRALEFIVDFMEGLLCASDNDSVAAICRSSYQKTLARFHTWLVRQAVALASFTLPDRKRLITSFQGEHPGEDYVRAVLSAFVQNGKTVYSSVGQLYDEFKIK